MRDLWPVDLPQVERDITDLSPRDVVPDTVDELLSWTWVGQKPSMQSPGRRHVLFHAGDDEELTQVAIRLQGFVQKLNIRPLGNWNRCAPWNTELIRANDSRRSRSGAMKAIQYVDIFGGPHDHIFQFQVQTLHNIEHLVNRTFGTRKPLTSGGSIHLQRRVFTKVCALKCNYTLLICISGSTHAPCGEHSTPRRRPHRRCSPYIRPVDCGRSP